MDTPSGSPLEYTIQIGPNWRSITGWQIPTADASSILKQWSYEGYTRLSLRLAHAWGVAVVVLKDPAAEEALLEEHDRQLCED
jgi:hypothetical protein